MSASPTTQDQWGMTVDVDKCTGCKSCVIACHAENNVAVVGAEQSAMGRLVHWLRIEPIHHGEHAHLEMDFIPMLCQQCGSAPCESVCPVFASVHTHDGLNAQVYNRCIGTRICANNCPYHVRMFNFYPPTWPEPLNRMLNPDVTARSEGVMEKCTFCVQRIRRGNLDAKVEGRTALDGEIRPACVQSCASEALVFGLLSDPESTVSRHLERNRSRSALVHADDHTHPNVIYLKPARNADLLEGLDLGLKEARAKAAQQSSETTATPKPAASASPAPVSSPAPGVGSSAPAAASTPVATPQPAVTP